MQRKTLYLIRHGETDSNVKDVIQGWNEKLTLTGLSQVHALARKLVECPREFPIEVIHTSKMMRAIQTASVIQPALGSHVIMHTSNHLHERLHPSYLHGMSTDEPTARNALEEMRSRFHDPTFDYADGETYSQLIERVDRAIDDIFADAHEHIAIVSHGVFLSALVCRALHGQHLTSHILARHGLMFPNTGITTLSFRHGRRFDGDAWAWVLKVGDNSHTFYTE